MTCSLEKKIQQSRLLQSIFSKMCIHIIINFLLRMSVLFYLQIIEEGPITVAPPETVKQLEQGARILAKCVNYIGAATIEYLYSMDSGKYYFLELNTRLQVYIICFSKHYEHGTNNVAFEFLVVLR